MPVHILTTSAISSSPTLLRSKVVSTSSLSWAACKRFSRSGIAPYCNSDMRPRSLLRRATSSSCLATSRSSLNCCTPYTEAFSEFQISNKSANSFSCWASSSSKLFKRAAAALSFSLRSASRSIFNWIMCRSNLSITSGLESISIRIRLPASSIKSIALSGNWRSVI